MSLPEVRRENRGVNDILYRYELRGISGVKSAIFRSVLFSRRGGTFLIFATAFGVNLSFVQRSLSGGHRRYFLRRSEIVLRFGKRAASRPSSDLMRRTEQLRAAAVARARGANTMRYARVFFV